MFKKIAPLLLIMGGTVSTLFPSIPVCASTVVDYHVKDNSQYLNESIPYNGNQHGWYKFSDGTWGYFIDYGKLIKNSLIHETDGDYAIGDNGRMVTGWFNNANDNKWYFFRSDGIMNKGWVQSDGLWYYTDNTGAMLTGWQKINERWYYFDKNTGVMAHNVKIDNYSLSSDGSLK